MENGRDQSAELSASVAKRSRLGVSADAWQATAPVNEATRLSRRQEGSMLNRTDGERGSGQLRRSPRRRYGAARLTVLVGSGIAAAGFWVGVVTAPMPARAKGSEVSLQPEPMAGMSHMAGGDSQRMRPRLLSRGS